MEEINRVKFSICRTFTMTNTKAIVFCLVIFLNHIKYSQGYSSVRRSGSGQQIDGTKRIQLDSNYIPNISPMIRPENSRTSNPLNQEFNIEIKQIEDTTTKEKSELNNNKNATEKNNNILKSDQNENLEKISEFKPISNEPRLQEFIQKQEEAIQIRTKEEIENQVHQKSIAKELGEAIELISEDDLSMTPKKKEKLNQLESELLGYIDQTLSKSSYNIFEGVKIEPVSTLRGRDLNVTGNGAPRSFGDSSSENEELGGFDTQVIEKIKSFAQNHVLSVNLPEAARFFGFKFGQGKSSFLTGFGLGFLAFGLKKLLLPVFIGAQIVKSVLIAMFLPSILGSLGKIVGKGLSQFSGASANFGQPHVQMDDLDYKDNMGYATENDPSYTYPNTDTLGTLPATALYGNKEDLANVAMSRFGPGGAKVTYLPSSSDNYYRTPYKKQEDYKVFHNIPASSLLLSNYDPFYSPLLSRLDSVFQRLGLGGAQATAPERCREKLVCLMYASPAKYAPYSNLISAQLSRELNELRKPTSDNPEILRFFRYMKAAKDGQEGGSCSRTYPNCPGLTPDTGSAAMITTYNDINKLVSARKL